MIPLLRAAGNSSDTYCSVLQGCTGIVWVSAYLLGLLGSARQSQEPLPRRIPSKCRHSDVLKNIMVHCSDLSFTRLFSQVLAHQDARTKFEDLTRLAQLNCAVDFGAKRALLELEALDLPHQQPFPLEAISVFAGREKITSDTVPYLRNFAHLQLAREEFSVAGVLSHTQFVALYPQFQGCSKSGHANKSGVWQEQTMKPRDGWQ